MNRSSSELDFQRFLDELIVSNPSPLPSPPPPPPFHRPLHVPHIEVIEIEEGSTSNDSSNNQNKVASTTSYNCPPLPPLNIPVDSDEYRAFLRSRLDLECRAVALAMANKYEKPQESTAKAILPDPSLEGQHGNVAGVGALGLRSELPIMQQKSCMSMQVKSTGSGSSRDQESEKDDQKEAARNMDSSGLVGGAADFDAKLMKRRVANREAAKKARRKKQNYLADLEAKVIELRVENSSLLKSFNNINQMYNKEAADNRVLKADVETLRAKVRMAEEIVKRLSLTKPNHENISLVGLPWFDSGGVAVQDYDYPIQHYHQNMYTSDNHLLSHENYPTIQYGTSETPSVDKISVDDIVQMLPDMQELLNSTIFDDGYMDIQNPATAHPGNNMGIPYMFDPRNA